MTAPESRSPAPRGDAKDRAGYFNRPANNTTARLELEGLARRLHNCGPRVIYELLADLLLGRDVAETLAEFSRLDPAYYAAIAALVLNGGAHGH
jgi:hypothetical protein